MYEVRKRGLATLDERSRNAKASRTRPAANAPTMGARPIAFASHARRKHEESPAASSTPPERRVAASAEDLRGKVDAESQRADEKHDGLAENRGDRAVGKMAARVGGHDDAADDREHYETQHVVDDGGTEDDPGFAALRSSEVLQDPGGDTDARGAERGAEEGVDVRAVFREEPRPDAPAQRERGDDSGRRYEHRGDADVEHLGYGRLETDLEEQDECTEASQHLEGRIGLDFGKGRDPTSERLPSTMPPTSSPRTAG